jgi:hypothetical protein
MKFLYKTEQSGARAKRQIVIDWPAWRPSFGKAILTAGVTAILPVVIKLIVLVGHQLLTVLQN